jgi:hypothetical protein
MSLSSPLQRVVRIDPTTAALLQAINQLRQTLAIWDVPVRIAPRQVQVAGTSVPVEVMPARNNRLRAFFFTLSGTHELQDTPHPTSTGIPVSSLTAGFLDDWPVCHKGAWHAIGTVAGVLLVVEWLRTENPDETP